MTEGLPNPEIEALRQDIERLKAELSTPQKEAEEKGKRDILREGAMEYWKAQNDYYKHLMTIGLASVAAFGALLAGPLSDSEVWSGPLWIRQGLIALAFSAFLTTVVWANGVALNARQKLLLVRNIETKEDLDRLVRDRALRWRSRATGLAFSVGWLACVTVVVAHSLS